VAKRVLVRIFSFCRTRLRSWLSWLIRREPSDHWARTTGTGILIASLGLICWIFYLGSTLPNTGPAQNCSTASLTGLCTWQLTWVGLDVLEVAGLASTGYLLRRSHRQTRTAALLAAPLFVVDGWFDVLTASSRSGMALSVAMLGLAELPVGIFLILIARRARAAGDHDPIGRSSWSPRRTIPAVIRPPPTGTSPSPGCRWLVTPPVSQREDAYRGQEEEGAGRRPEARLSCTA
jgi:hypothetical protein